MRNFLRSLPVRKLGLVAAVALLAAAGTIAPRTAQAACHDWTEYYTYYTDATKTTEAGWCEYDCYCVSYCDGTKTPYYNHTVWNGCL